MTTAELARKCTSYLQKFCVDISDRSVGSEGNRAATHFFESELVSLGWDTEAHEIDAIDWVDGGASLLTNETSFNVLVSPYSLGCQVKAQLVAASNVEMLEAKLIQDKIVLLHGDIAKEQLMPKNFMFYNPEEHKRIISILESKKPGAIVSATGRNPAVAGGVYPFPLIEDGDFNIPSVYTTEEEGEKILSHEGAVFVLYSESERVPGNAYNVIARKGDEDLKRIVITAHIDAKKGTPGAIDNATGVIVLLYLAELLADYSGDKCVEIVAFNGEDYYAVPGQMDYIARYQEHFDDILVNINIDGAGYKDGKSAFSYYGLPDDIQRKAGDVVGNFDGINEGGQWVQGDHSIFVQFGRPALAVTSNWFYENMNSQEITHTPRDNPDIVDCQKVIEIAQALSELVRLI